MRCGTGLIAGPADFQPEPLFGYRTDTRASFKLDLSCTVRQQRDICRHVRAVRGIPVVAGILDDHCMRPQRYTPSPCTQPLITANFTSCPFGRRQCFRTLPVSRRHRRTGRRRRRRPS